MSRYLFVVIDYPRQAVDARLQHLARSKRWRLLRVERGDLSRLHRLSPRGAAVAVGATLPRAGLGAIVTAFATLRRNDMVYGPDDDGFCWLVGWSRRRRVPPKMLRPALDEALAAMPANFWVELMPSEDYPPLRL